MSEIAANNWTDPRILALKLMWADGLSAKQIAGQLGSVTRNAVLGKIHRLGLADTAPKSKKPHSHGGPRPILSREEKAQRQQARAFMRKAAVQPAVPKDLPEPPPAVTSFLNLAFAQLQYGDCRFPIGEESPFVYCGNPTINGTSWCRECFDFTHAPKLSRRAA